MYRAVGVLEDHSYVDGSRLTVMGFSFGGRAAIWSAFTRFQDTYDGKPFAGHITFYPSTCYIELADEAMNGGRRRIFHGIEDNWTPINQCQDMIDRLASAGVDAAINSYPNAGHSFDNPGLAWGVSHFSPASVSPRNCTFIEIDGEIIDSDTGSAAGVGSTCVERGVNYAYDSVARAAAASELLDFLDTILTR